MTRPEPSLLDAAALWVVRTRDPLFGDWEAFTIWLEADPAHNSAYEAALDAHDVAGGLSVRPEPPVVPDAAIACRPSRGRARPIWLAAVAAALVAAVCTPLLLPGRATYAVETGLGEQRSVKLADGTQIALNGNTRLILDRNDPRSVLLDRGEASFTIVHDAADPFVLRVGDARIEDVGTVFNVSRDEDGTDVAVAEGAVLYDPDGAHVTLAAGAALHDERGSDRVQVGRVAPEAVGAWRRGRLVYRDAPLATVAADLSRATGQRVTLAPDVDIRRFSGTIQYRGVSAQQLFGRVGALTGTRVTHGVDGWRLSSGTGAPR